MKRTLPSTLLFLSLLNAHSASAISVDNMIIVSNYDVDKITVVNQDPFPVVVGVKLSELDIETKKETDLAKENFKEWPIYISRDEFIIDQNSRYNLKINNLSTLLGKTNNQDRVIGISLIPKSYENRENNNNSLSILTGYKVWYILPHQKEKVSGDTSVTYTNNKIELSNNTDTAIKFTFNSCEININSECGETAELVLSGKSKKLDVITNESKMIKFATDDFLGRYSKKITVKI